MHFHCNLHAVVAAAAVTCMNRLPDIVAAMSTSSFLKRKTQKQSTVFHCINTLRAPSKFPRISSEPKNINPFSPMPSSTIKLHNRCFFVFIVCFSSVTVSVSIVTPLFLFLFTLWLLLPVNVNVNVL